MQNYNGGDLFLVDLVMSHDNHIRLAVALICWEEIDVLELQATAGQQMMWFNNRYVTCHAALTSTSSKKHTK